MMQGIIAKQNFLKMKVINLTPHNINILDESGNNVKTFAASGSVARLPMTTEPAGQLPDGTPLSRTVMHTDRCEGLPDPQQGTYFIVSLAVKTAFPQRGDLLVPAEAVRDDKGRIIGCRSLGV